MQAPAIEPRHHASAPAHAARPFRTVAVLGAGTMGAQIAAHCANAGLTVHLLDVAPATIGREGPPNSIVEAAFKQATRLKPDPLFTRDVADRIVLGNFEEHFDRLAQVDWVIEAVVERLDVKRSVMERIEDAVGEETVVSSNTSGIPIRDLVEGRSASFRRRFLGTHFFNPPRYLKLLELVPGADTDPDVLARVAAFGRVHLGKGIVVAKDSPYFIGNRVGMYAMMRALAYFTDGSYTIEEIDTLTGPLVGHPKSATFRTADVVGLDVMRDVANNLYAAVPDDESRDAFRSPEILDRLVEEGALGAKTRAGFYKKEGKAIHSIDPATGTYTEPAPMRLEGLDRVQQAGGLADRLRALYEDDGRAGAFFRETTLDLLAYAARRIPEVTDHPADLDRALRWGFGWEMGPFQMWDALGFETVLRGMDAAGVEVPAWVRTMAAKGRTQFYRGAAGEREVYAPAREAYLPDPRPADEWGLAVIARDDDRVLWRNEEAALLDLGDGVGCYQFRSKANSLGARVMGGLMEVIDRVERDRDLRGLVIGNEGGNFSVGANLGEAMMALAQGGTRQVEEAVERFQEAIQRVHYAEKPVVVAAHQRVLGGGCEMVMACPNPVAAAESYLGLVELGVGLIPAGTGTMRLAALASERAPNGHPSEVQASVQAFFEQVAMAQVATSARQAQQMGYLPPHARIVMNADRRFHVAKNTVLHLSEAGYLPPPRKTAIQVLGRQGRAALEVAAYQYQQGGFISEYDLRLARELAHVLCGGDLTTPQTVDEAYLLELEREAFMRLLGEEKTRARIEHILTTNKPLRN